jgi:hypothetical protein
MTKYTIDAARCEFIETNFFQWSFRKPDDFRPDKDLFLRLSHPSELHYLASIYNWDDGALVLEWVLESDLCTRSTANLLFWRSAPDWYLRCDIDDESSCPEFNRDGFKVIRRVMAKYKTGDFANYQIAFNPKDEIESVDEQNPKWSYPSGVYDIIEGVEVVVQR